MRATDRESGQVDLAPTLAGLLTGQSVLIVGIEDDPEPGLLRVYIGARYNGTYVLVSAPDDQRRIRQAWGSTAGHIYCARPPDDAIYVDKPCPRWRGRGEVTRNGH